MREFRCHYDRDDICPADACPVVISMAAQGVVQFEPADAPGERCFSGGKEWQKSDRNRRRREGEAMKRKFLNISCLVLLILIAGVLIWGRDHKVSVFQEAYDDGVEQIDLNTIYLEDGGVEVNFSEVLLGKQEETRKLIVSTQEATVSTELSDRLIRKLDFDFLKKTQKVSYTGKGYFVVDLDNLTGEDIIEDKEKRIITIKIGHAYLQAIEIDPDKIIVDEVKEGLLARGDIELTVKDLNTIERELRSRLEREFNTAESGQEADDLAINMVREVYEPIVRAIDKRYSVAVEFK